MLFLVEGDGEYVVVVSCSPSGQLSRRSIVYPIHKDAKITEISLHWRNKNLLCVLYSNSYLVLYSIVSNPAMAIYHIPRVHHLSSFSYIDSGYFHLLPDILEPSPEGQVLGRPVCLDFPHESVMQIIHSLLLCRDGKLYSVMGDDICHVRVEGSDSGSKLLHYDVESRDLWMFLPLPIGRVVRLSLSPDLKSASVSASLEFNSKTKISGFDCHCMMGNAMALSFKGSVAIVNSFDLSVVTRIDLPVSPSQMAWSDGFLLTCQPSGSGQEVILFSSLFENLGNYLPSHSFDSDIPIWKHFADKISNLDSLPVEEQRLFKFIAQEKIEKVELVSKPAVTAIDRDFERYQRGKTIEPVKIMTHFSLNNLTWVDFVRMNSALSYPELVKLFNALHLYHNEREDLNFNETDEMLDWLNELEEPVHNDAPDIFSTHFNESAPFHVLPTIVHREQKRYHDLTKRVRHFSSIKPNTVGIHEREIVPNRARQTRAEKLQSKYLKQFEKVRLPFEMRIRLLPQVKFDFGRNAVRSGVYAQAYQIQPDDYCNENIAKIASLHWVPSFPNKRRGEITLEDMMDVVIQEIKNTSGEVIPSAADKLQVAVDMFNDNSPALNSYKTVLETIWNEKMATDASSSFQQTVASDKSDQLSDLSESSDFAVEKVKTPTNLPVKSPVQKTAAHSSAKRPPTEAGVTPPPIGISKHEPALPKMPSLAKSTVALSKPLKPEQSGNDRHKPLLLSNLGKTGSPTKKLSRERSNVTNKLKSVKPENLVEQIPSATVPSKTKLPERKIPDREAESITPLKKASTPSHTTLPVKPVVKMQHVQTASPPKLSKSKSSGSHAALLSMPKFQHSPQKQLLPSEIKRTKIKIWKSLAHDPTLRFQFQGGKVFPVHTKQ